MALQLDENFLTSMISTLKDVACLGYNSIGALETNENLSVVGQNHLNALKFCTLQTNRLCNVMSFLMSSTPDDDGQILENFEIENLINEIINRFSKSVSAYSPVSAETHINLKDTVSIILNKAKFELIFLNILYCCIKKTPGSKTVPLKLSIHVTENKNNIVFHIHSSSTCLTNEFVGNILFGSGSLPGDISDNSFKALISMSLNVAQKAAKQIGGSVSHTSLKRGNRFDISLPKFQHDLPGYSACSTVPYIPTYSYYNEIFADIRLEALLQNIVDELEKGGIFTGDISSKIHQRND